MAPASTLEPVLAYANEHLCRCERFAGHSYAEHGREVAEILQEVIAHPPLLRAAVLHDLWAHPEAERLLRESPLTDDEQALVRAWREQTTPLRCDDARSTIDWPVPLRHSIDPRLHILLAAHHINDIRHLERFSAGERRWIGTCALREAALGMRALHVHRWAAEVEECCLNELQPLAARTLREQAAMMQASDHRCLEHMAQRIGQLLVAEGIPHELECRQKGLYSTYRKMQLTGKPFDQILDRLGIRILAPDIPACYRVLRVLHRHYLFTWEEFGDFIRAPKQNGYQSLHTLLLSPPEDGGLAVEIQIRTQEMHWRNIYGPARHTFYKWVRYDGVTPALA